MPNLFPEITVNAHCPFPCWYVYSFFFFLTLEADKSESKTFNKVGPENSTWKNYLSAKFQSYSEYACAVPDMTFTTNRFRNDRFCCHVGQSHHVIGRKSRDTIHRTTLPRAVQNTNYFASEWSKSVG